MNIVYFSHSYREEDNFVVSFFGKLIQSQGLVLSIDPPSENINAAKLERHFNSTDGMIAVLSRREGGVSEYIHFEISLCLRARKPLLVFVEDNIDTKRIPSRVLQKRFSRRYLPLEIKEHTRNTKFEGLYGRYASSKVSIFQQEKSLFACWVINSP